MKVFYAFGLSMLLLLGAISQGLAQEKAKYQVVVCGFHCKQETHDHALQVDGKRDEIWLVVRYLDPATGQYKTFRTRTMGDVNGIAGREQAGSASDKGGIQKGDVHPANRFDGKPMKPSGAEWAESDHPSLPFVVKEFELAKGEKPSAVEIQIWEDDMGGAKDWEKVLGFLNSDIAKQGLSNVKVYSSSDSPAVGNTQVTLNLSGIGNVAKDIFGLAADGLVGEPQTVALNFDTAAKISSETVDGLPKGVIPLNFKGHRGDSADYVVWIRIEKVSQ